MKATPEDMEIYRDIAKQALSVEPVAWKPDMAHLANEWADVATNSISWLRNIKDGISTVDEAIENTTEGLKHCRDVCEAVRGQVAVPDAAIIKEIVINADYREMWADQVRINQKICAQLAAPQGVKQ